MAQNRTYKPSIKFSEEWDKLRPENRNIDKYFTTVRGYEPKKEAYYRRVKKQEFDVYVRDVRIGCAILEDVSTCRASDIPNEFWENDTHAGWTYTKDQFEKGEVNKFFEKFYDNENPFLLYLQFKWTKFY